MKKHKLLPKVPVDDMMVKRLNNFYHSKLQYPLEVQCFSQPILETHFCNPEVLVEGKSCKYCGNIQGKMCKILCDLNHFCLVVFAYRLGVGGSDLDVALKSNAKLSWSDLRAKVAGALKGAIAEDEEPVVEEPLSLKLKSVKIPKPLGELTADLIDLAQAAEIYGCTPENIYHFVKTQKLEAAASPDGRCFVSLADIRKLKESQNA
jgi:hypothetical protein